jgi:hypothetical protein
MNIGMRWLISRQKAPGTCIIRYSGRGLKYIPHNDENFTDETGETQKIKPSCF